MEKYLHQEKLEFANENCELLGTMQFPFDVVLTEAIIDQRFHFSRILKIPTQQMSVERIVDTYEITIKDRYPYLDYILKNQSTFSKI